MTKLTKFAAPALAAAMALATAMPAQARDTGRAFHKESSASRNMHDYRPAAVPTKPSARFAIRAEITDLKRDIERASAHHQISWREAASLRGEAHRLDRLYWSYARGGLSHRELASLNQKTARLRVALNINMHDRDRHRG